jgi:hypothetical protein
MAKKMKGNVPRPTPEEAKRIVDLLDKRAVEFSGSLWELEQALGFYLVGRHIGWKPLVLIHNKRTIRKYEQILGIEIRKEFEEEGPDYARMDAYMLAKKAANFWKAVSGDVKLDTEDRRHVS